MNINSIAPMNTSLYWLFFMFYVASLTVSITTADNNHHKGSKKKIINRSLLQSQPTDTTFLSVTNYGNLNPGWQRYIINNVDPQYTITEVYISDDGFINEIIPMTRLSWLPNSYGFVTSGTYVSLPISIKIIAANGEDSDEVTAYDAITSYTNQDEFDLDDNFGLISEYWVSLAALPVEISEISAMAVNGADSLGYYVFGGETATEKFDGMYYYDIASDGWTQLNDPPKWLGTHQTAQVYNGKIYAFGGDEYKYGFFMRCYDPNTDSWQGLAMLVVNNKAHNLVSPSSGIVDGVIYVVGGLRGAGTVDDAFAYDIETNTWNTDGIEPMPDGGRNHAAAIGYNGLFYVFGGRQGDMSPKLGFKTGFVYDPVDNTWGATADMLEEMGGNGQAVEVGGKLLVIGGETDVVAVGVVQMYDPEQDSWSYLSEMITPRHGIAPVAIGNVVYVVAGGTEAGLSQSDLHEALVIE